MSSISKTFRSFPDQITMSGRSSVAKISGGKTYFESGRSTNTFQSFEPAIKPEWSFLIDFVGGLPAGTKEVDM